MLGDTNVEIDVAQILLAMTALIVALGVPALIAAVSGRRNSKSLERLENTADTGNGKDLGQTVHDMAQTVEVVAAQAHTNTRELLELRQQLTDHVDDSQRVHDRLLNELDRTDRREEPGG